MLHTILIVIFKMSNPFAKFKINFLCYPKYLSHMFKKKTTGLTKHYTRWAKCYSFCRHFYEYNLSKFSPYSSLFNLFA